MAAVLAHEINNPLSMVMNILYLARNTDGLPESARQFLDLADAELKSIAHITRRTLGFYRESSAPTTFQTASLLDSVLDLLQVKIKSKQAIVERQCDEQLQITAMYGELRQVFANLLGNSVDAVGEYGKITLRASTSLGTSDGTRRIRVTVADNGHGTRAATLLKIFEPFFTTKGELGNGLGLWVSKQIIDKHGGSVRVRSCTNGSRQGTTFLVVLPASTT